MLPMFWRRASFRVTEVAEIIGVTEDCVRGWLSRNPSNTFLGVKKDGKIWLSGQDAFFYLLISALTGFGVPVRFAMNTAEKIVDQMDDGPPPEGYLTVRILDGEREVVPAFEPEVERAPALVIPINDLFHLHLAQCADVYSKERV